jgi:transcriptional regulator with XRE-family HTH domain
MSNTAQIQLTAPTLGGRLRQAREANKLTQAVVAARLKVAAPRVVEWEQDQHVPKPPRIRSLAVLYGVDPEDLIPEGHPLRERRPRPADGATVSVPREEAQRWRDEAMRWRGRLEVVMEWQQSSQRTTQSLYDDLGRSIARLGEFLESDVLPVPGREIRWEYIPEPPTAVDPDNGE